MNNFFRFLRLVESLLSFWNFFPFRFSSSLFTLSSKKTTALVRRVQWSSTFTRLVDSLLGSAGRSGDPVTSVPKSAAAPCIGIALSGGVDSAVVALCVRLLQHPELWLKVFRREEHELALAPIGGNDTLAANSGSTSSSISRLYASQSGNPSPMTVGLSRWKWNEDEALLSEALQKLSSMEVLEQRSSTDHQPILTAWHMRNWTADAEDGSGQRIGADAVDCQDGHQRDAEEVARRLHLPLQFLDFSVEYWHRCFTPMINELEQGRILNPDILCNSEIKFERMSKTISSKMTQLLSPTSVNPGSGAMAPSRKFVATGHYATLLQCTESDLPSPPLLAQPWTILSGKDRLNDQTHFLARVAPSQFSGNGSLQRNHPATTQAESASQCEAIFPLGELFNSKADVRRFARLGVHFTGRAAEKKTSVGICFVGRRSWKDFASQYLEDKLESPQSSDSEHRPGLKLLLEDGNPFPATLSLNPNSPPEGPVQPVNMKLYVVGEKLTFYDLENKERRATNWKRQRSFYVQRKCTHGNTMYLVEGDPNHSSLFTRHWFAVDLVHHLNLSTQPGIKCSVSPEMHEAATAAVADYRKWFPQEGDDPSMDRFLTAAATANQDSLVQWRALVSCRHHDPPAWATVLEVDEAQSGESSRGAIIIFDQPRRAAASGQGAVFQLPLSDVGCGQPTASVAVPNVVVAMGWIRSPLG